MDTHVLPSSAVRSRKWGHCGLVGLVHPRNSRRDLARESGFRTVGGSICLPARVCETLRQTTQTKAAYEQRDEPLAVANGDASRHSGPFHFGQASSAGVRPLLLCSPALPCLICLRAYDSKLYGGKPRAEIVTLHGAVQAHVWLA